eukprot:scaffold168418_cov136-Cyclotella_meneghiniana.AAC.3
MTWESLHFLHNARCHTSHSRDIESLRVAGQRLPLPPCKGVMLNGLENVGMKICQMWVPT